MRELAMGFCDAGFCDDGVFNERGGGGGGGERQGEGGESFHGVAGKCVKSTERQYGFAEGHGKVAAFA